MGSIGPTVLLGCSQLPLISLGNSESCICILYKLRFVFVFIVDIDMNWEPVAADQFWARTVGPQTVGPGLTTLGNFLAPKNVCCEYIGAKSILY